MRISRRAILAAPLLQRADAQVTPATIRLASELEPLARLFENTDRDKCPAMLSEQLARGVSYRQLMAALFLAGIRNVNPRPPGFALHCVFVMHAAHQLSLEGPSGMRHLPIYFALDQFKASQARDSAYTMTELTGRLPWPERAMAELQRGFDGWEFDRAERAAAVLARSTGAHEVFELLWKYGVRDYRNIGHKAIYVANAYRTLVTIGWQYAEPVLRSMALALTDFGPETKMNGFAMEDQTWNSNLRRPPDAWNGGPSVESDVRGILSALRSAAPIEASADVAARLSKGARIDDAPGRRWCHHRYPRRQRRQCHALCLAVGGRSPDAMADSATGRWMDGAVPRGWRSARRYQKGRRAWRGERTVACGAGRVAAARDHQGERGPLLQVPGRRCRGLRADERAVAAEFRSRDEVLLKERGRSRHRADEGRLGTRVTAVTRMRSQPACRSRYTRALRPRNRR
jgi:hypothetical protein